MLRNRRQRSLDELEQEWLDQINEIEKVDEYAQAILVPIGRAIVGVGRAAIKGAQVAGKAVAKGAQAVARGASKVAKNVAKGAKNVAKKTKKSVKKKGNNLKDKMKDKIKDKVKDKIKDKAMDKLRDMQKKIGSDTDDKDVSKQLKKDAEKGRKKDSKATGGSGGGRSKYLGAGKEYKMKNQLREQLRRQIAFVLLESEGGEADSGDGKKLSPEMAKAVNAELEGKTVKSKAGKEIKVTSAMNPSYKEREPATYKKAKAMFSKALEKVIQDTKKASGKDDPKKDDPKKDDQAPIKKTEPVKQKAAKSKGRPRSQTKVPPKTFDTPPQNLTPEQLKAEIIETSKKFDKGENEVAAAKSITAKVKTTGTFEDIRKAVKYEQKVKQDRFDAHVNKANAVSRNFESITSREDELKKQYRNPFSKERREGLKKLKQEKNQVLEDSGMTTDEITQMQAQKHMKDHYDQQIDPTNSEGQSTVKIGGKEYEIANTIIDNDGNVSLKTYALDDDGNKMQDENGEYVTEDIPASEAWNKDETEDSKEDKEDSEFDWDDFWDNQTDFAGHDYDNVFGDTDSSGYVNSGYVGKGKLVESKMKLNKNVYRDFDELEISQGNRVQFKKQESNYLVRYVSSNSYQDKDIMKILPRTGETRFAGRYYYTYDGNLTPIKLNKSKFNKLLSAIDKGWKRHAKSFADFYKDRVADGTMKEKVDIKKHGKFGQTGVPFPVEIPNEFAYLDFVKYAKKNEKKIKAQLSKLRDDRIFKVMEMIWTVWDKKTNKGAFSNIRGNKFGRALVKMLWDNNIIFNNKSHKITRVKEASGEMPKGKWIRLSGKALDKFRDELIDLITIAYKPIGGHANFKSAGDVQGSGHLWHAVDLDDDPSPDAVNIYKYRSAGTKSVGLGHDGSGKAKSSVIKNKVGNLKKQPFYAEVSGKMYKILKGKGVPVVDDEQTVRDVLKGKDIKWHGNGWYTRSIGGGSHKKIMMGFPKS